MPKPRTKGEWYRQTYLKSQHWRETSSNYKRLVGWRCERCRWRRIDVVHHLHYESLGHEEPADLAAWCNECHRAMHRYPIAANDNQLQLPFCVEEQQKQRKMS